MPEQSETLLKIGLTGGIASGKSAVSSLFQDLDITVIDADKIARDLLNKNSPLLVNIKDKFGSSVFTQEEELDRKALGRAVFKSSSDLAWLNQLMHPIISEKINQQLQTVHSDYVVLDIPLLIDKQGYIPQHLKKFIDKVLVINTSEKNQLNRLCQRENITTGDALQIINTQSSLEQKLNLADDIIDNNSDINQLKPQVNELHKTYLSLVKGRNN